MLSRRIIIHLVAIVTIAVTSLLSVPVGTESTARPGIDWPSFRGVDASGISETPALPTVFSPSASRWKTRIPGLGLSSPVIWGDLLCVTTAIREGSDVALKTAMSGSNVSVDDEAAHDWKIICLDKKTGAMRWERTVVRGVPKIKRHAKGTHANSTLATDGTHLAAMFGSEGLYVYDLKGTLLWRKDFGVLDSGSDRIPDLQWGFASSPIIHEGMLIIQADVQKGSFLTALDVKTGKPLWQTSRDEVPTWSTPAVVSSGGRPQLVLNGRKHIGGYDLRTGRELWRLSSTANLPVPTPVFGHGLIFIAGVRGPASPLFAVRPTATGDISLAEGQTSNAHVAWSDPQYGSYSTPILYGDYLYGIQHQGVLAVYEAKTGKQMYQQRLASGWFSASPVANAGHVYFTSEEGEVFVVKAGATYELIAKNQLEAVCLASPAISEGLIFFRTHDHIMAF